MEKRTRQVVAAVAAVVSMLAVGGAVRAAEPAAGGADPTPEQVVTRYLEAMKAGNFAAAYDQLTKGMTQNKSREDWAKEQQWASQMSDTKVLDYKVYPGKIEGNTAHVPNLLNAQDKFLNQLGVQEHELYTLIREDGRWKINQQVLLEKADQGPWFRPPGK